MKNRVSILMCLLLTLFMSQTSFGSDIEELNTYFEIRDTIKLMNSEMESGIKSSDKPSIFDEKDIELKIESFIGFMKGRISVYAVSDSRLKFHYIKKLESLLDETMRLFAQAKPIIQLRHDLEAPMVEKVITPTSYATVTHPYFDSIDFRTLASREPLNEEPKEILSVSAVPATFETNNTGEDRVTSKKVEAKAVSEVKAVKAETANTKAKAVKAEKTETTDKEKDIKQEIAKSANKKDKEETKKVFSQKGDKIVEKSTEEGFMRPMAIMVENHNQARPQSGLYLADVLYEMPVEGGITRFMGVFTRAPSLIGPVRSCREYFVDRALEAEALYVHCGGSPMGYAYISKSKIRSIDEIKNSPPFFRDKVRKAPHNLYGKGELIYNYMAKRCSMRVATEPAILSFGKREETGELPGEYLKINYHSNYNLVCKYEEGVYHRYMNNILHLDRETKKPLKASAIVLQTAVMRTVDSIGRQEISFIGSGKACILEKGRRTNVTWHKQTPRARTVYLDNNGKEYLFDKGGQIWILVVSPNHRVSFGTQNAVAETKKSVKLEISKENTDSKTTPKAGVNNGY